MTCLLARMTASLLLLSTLLLTMLLSIFAFAWLVTGLSALMGTTLEGLATDQTAESITSPARLIFERLLPTLTLLLRQERTLWAILLVHMAIVRNGRMTTCCWTATRKRARWRLRTTRQWSLQNRTSTVACDVVEYSFFATATGSAMTQIGASMVATFQRSSALPRTDVFRLDVMLGSWCC